MNTQATVTTTTPALVSTFCTRLAPPFGPEWTPFRTPKPKGYWFTCQLDSGNGSGRLGLGAEPHPPGSPLTIGWVWAGWKRRVLVHLATAYTFKVHCSQLTFNGSGTWVPRCFVTLRPLAGGAEISSQAVLAQGRETSVTVVAPQSSQLPAGVAYELTVAFSIRASYSGAKNPQGELRAHVVSVESCFAYPHATEELSTLAAPDFAASDFALPESDPSDLDVAELAAAWGELGRGAKTYEIESERAALAAGLVNLDE